MKTGIQNIIGVTQRADILGVAQRVKDVGKQKKKKEGKEDENWRILEWASIANNSPAFRMCVYWIFIVDAIILGLRTQSDDIIFMFYEFEWLIIFLYTVEVTVSLLAQFHTSATTFRLGASDICAIGFLILSIVTNSLITGVILLQDGERQPDIDTASYEVQSFLTYLCSYRPFRVLRIGFFSETLVFALETVLRSYIRIILPMGLILIFFFFILAVISTQLFETVSEVNKVSFRSNYRSFITTLHCSMFEKWADVFYGLDHDNLDTLRIVYVMFLTLTCGALGNLLFQNICAAVLIQIFPEATKSMRELGGETTEEFQRRIAAEDTREEQQVNPSTVQKRDHLASPLMIKTLKVALDVYEDNSFVIRQYLMELSMCMHQLSSLRELILKRTMKDKIKTRNLMHQVMQNWALQSLKTSSKNPKAETKM